MDKIRLTIDGKAIEAKKGSSVLEAAREGGIYIPSLCYHPLLSGDGSCGICLVEIDGVEDLPLSCVTIAAEGMAVHTATPEARARQREALIRGPLSRHPCACLDCERRERCGPFDICLRNVAVTERCVLCPKNKRCELQDVVDFFGLEGEVFPYTYRNLPVHRDNPLFERDYNLCISCSRCVRMCEGIRGIGAIAMTEQDGERLPAPSDGKSLQTSECRFCRACVEVCPTGALIDKEVWGPEVDREAVAAPCRNACPAGVDAARYVYLISVGKFDEAIAVNREKLPFPRALGRVCIHPCETACHRGKFNEPIAIKALKRFVADRDTGEWKQYSKSLPPTGKKAAVVGAGPAGLTVAYNLAKMGHSVTVFEALPVVGGMMRVGIPDYRLPPEVLESEVDEIRNAGVEIKLNTRIDSVDALMEQGYDAVFLGLGAHRGTKMGVEGEDSPGVLDGATFLRKANLGEKVDVGRSVAVIGGGNTAIDSARTALRLGAAEVTIIYRRTRAEMPASPEEVEAALHEDIKMIFLAAPEKVSNEKGRLNLTCIRMKLGEPDASGRRRPEPIKGSEFTTPFDSIIAAIGQVPDIPEPLNVKTGRGNVIQVNSRTMATSIKGVYAGGDAVSGPASVVEAIAAGRKAASAMDKYLGGSGDITEKLAQDREFGLCAGKESDFIERKRAQVPELSKAKRAGNFSEVELGFDEKTAVSEAKRCLQCAVRLDFPAAPKPPTSARKAHRKVKVAA